MLWLSKDSYFTEPPISEPHARKLRFLENYRFIEAMFRDGFQAWEVIELCDDHEMDPVDAAVLTQCWLTLNMRDDEFNIDTPEAGRFFNVDGTVKTAEYLASVYTRCYLCRAKLQPYTCDSHTPGLCHACAHCKTCNVHLRENQISERTPNVCKWCEQREETNAG